MAEDKKPDAKKDDKKGAPPAGGGDKDPFVEVASVIAVLMLVVYLVNGLVTSINSSRIFSHGLNGLTPRNILLAHTKPIFTLENPVGARVVSINNTDVYSTPDGQKIGEQEFGAKGKVLQGPVDVERERYWYVDYDTPQDGWVKEDNIAYLEAEPNLLARIIMNIWSVVWYIKLILILFSVICVVCIVYLFRKIMALAMEENKKLYPPGHFDSSVTNFSVPPPDRNIMWDRILTQLESTSQNDWKHAILDADIMLGIILDSLSLPGDTMGEKLKAVEKSDFTTLDYAWEAHKIRNQIAHEGSSFLLNQREAKRVISLYQAVFQEFNII